MNKEHLIQAGLVMESITDVSDLGESYEGWKADVLRYAVTNHLDVEQCRIMLHIVAVTFEPCEETIRKYHTCIKRVVSFLQKEITDSYQKVNALETMIDNFGLYLQNMFCSLPENRSTLRKEVLEQIVINNEYDVQHIMYAVVKALYPSARREVNQDIGYGTVRYDIIIEEIDTVIEIKCTRKDHSENKLLRELGEGAFFYKCSKLIVYVYDKQRVIRDVNNFVLALERNRENSGKDIKVYVEQVNELI